MLSINAAFSRKQGNNWPNEPFHWNDLFGMHEGMCDQRYELDHRIKDKFSKMSRVTCILTRASKPNFLFLKYATEINWKLKMSPQTFLSEQFTSVREVLKIYG